MQGSTVGAGKHPGWSVHAHRPLSTGQRVTPTQSGGRSFRSIALVLSFGLLLGLVIGLMIAYYTTSGTWGGGQALEYRQLVDSALWPSTTPATSTTRGPRIRVGNALLHSRDGMGPAERVLSPKQSLVSGQTVNGSIVRGDTAKVSSRTNQADTLESERQCQGLATLKVDPEGMKDRRLNVVLLATYPRSGNSWARTLFRTATQIKSDLTTAKGVSSLEEMGRLSTCPECDVKEYSRMYQKLGVGWVSNVKNTRPLYGIKGTPNDSGACSELFTEKEANSGKPWPYFPDHPPIMVKTHYPQIGDSKVEKFTLNSVTRVIHIVRNPFDNIASRFLGNQRQHQSRFDDLVEARKKGQTTKPFKKFLDLELDRIKKFHSYWFERRLSDAERGVPTLYVRYEAMCRDTPAVLSRMLEFSGYRELPATLACTLNEFKCHSGNSTMPVHLGLFTEGQVERILDTQSRSLDAFGYVWDRTLQTLALEDRPVLCEW